jgi:hypothetical protein
MAGADYYSCDICGCKTFYDAQLDYDDNGDLPRVGDMKVLCNECAETHRVVIEVIE